MLVRSGCKFCLFSGRLYQARYPVFNGTRLLASSGIMPQMENISTAPKPLNEMFSTLPTTIFSVMTDLANKHKSINLGQGAPQHLASVRAVTCSALGIQSSRNMAQGTFEIQSQ